MYNIKLIFQDNKGGGESKEKKIKGILIKKAIIIPNTSSYCLFLASSLQNGWGCRHGFLCFSYVFLLPILPAHH
ncbi:hypothetical protein A8F95_15365 [Bacillus wudalianchiensis]|uniref:Uncharacterized protein n=1 Tax=Pseudobacillus wudalianchiensis TaxID=1743143 RepID=A0A1B9AE09_9BACI|nr:hypothetical protein A8F95_15365 [Bacillus wudalianchiensis]